MSSSYRITITLNRTIDQPSRLAYLMALHEWTLSDLSGQRFIYMSYRDPLDYDWLETSYDQRYIILQVLDNDFQTGNTVGFNVAREDKDSSILFSSDKHRISILPSNGDYWKTPKGMLDINKYIEEFVGDIVAIYGAYTAIEAHIMA